MSVCLLSSLCVPALGVNAVLSSSTSYYAPFISAIFDISYDSKHLDLDPATATAAALAGLQQMSGEW